METATTDTAMETAMDSALATVRHIAQLVANLDEEEAVGAWLRGLSPFKLAEVVQDYEAEYGSNDFGIGDPDVLLDAIQSAILQGVFCPDGWEYDREAIEEELREMPLSVEVRSAWHTPGEESEPAEFCISLTTGGPAVRIVGDIDLEGRPYHPRVQCADWHKSWQNAPLDRAEREAINEFCELFTFTY